MQHKLIPKISIVSNIVKLNDSLKETWAYKDILIDSVPGLSILKAHNLTLSHEKEKEVFVAILDSEIDINHKAINNNIWINLKEIPR
ncbi:hypothetical protein N7U66_10015 [Lacinutrix neustonica]|uniref:Uncharacterized protein n=1 Tax=Lacinutrix neustonica TaxID=2980107 RepID=A0A9E8SIJ0_9FLAO|nr:hypothetical protein [Lacinutrix neustonica]WAC03725.1 hypothetical protein N7U66_10015 [Lacinutrix neustonica]